MNPKSILLQPIGVIRTPFKEVQGMPIQPGGARQARGRIDLRPEYTPGLADLGDFSHLILIYYFHRAGPLRLTVTPFLDSQSHGLFATRAPSRPNPIGLSVVALTAIKDNILEVEGVDMLDGTPLLDIKPYVPAFDSPEDPRCGWLEDAQQRAGQQRSDGRFA